MVVGVCRIDLAIPETADLKGKRSIVKRVIARTRQQFHLAMAEVDFLDDPGSAVLGVAVVANDHRFVNSLLDRIVTHVEGLGLAEVEGHQIEILHLL